MELRPADIYSGRLTSSSLTIRLPFVPGNWRPTEKPPLFLVKSAKGSIETSKGFQRESKKKLSHILIAEAAVRNIERKASATSKLSNLWPKAVLDALDESIQSKQWQSALKIFKLLRKQQWYVPKCQTYAKLLTMLGKSKQPEHAISLFRTMLSEGLEPTLDVYTSLVGVYGMSGLFDEAFLTIDEMKSVSGCIPDVFTYTILINTCCKHQRFDLFRKILNDMSYLGIECSAVTFNTIIDGYGKAGFFELMENSLSDMLESGQCLPDVFTLNSFIWAYGSSGEIEKMEKWYDEFQHMGVTPDIKTFNILIKSYGRVGMFDKIYSVLKFMKKRFFSPTIVTYNIIIEAYGKAGNIETMDYFFRLMKHQGMKPNSITFCSLVSGYSKAGLLARISSIRRQIENSDVVLDTPFFNCIISAYGQAGQVEKMEEMLTYMKECKCNPDTITFATMRHAYNGQGMVEAIKELELMYQELVNEKKLT
ncbi:pentatricopeptide repeat-containing protein At3g53170 [Aristolochia californica]|uniref:pentatricopeptide repeat-containing protein At3g53170 n=1 Tax=Aristolochia californica TaxID=171875 RepID=UPI0035DBFCA1